jgi:hypothetical protein
LYTILPARESTIAVVHAASTADSREQTEDSRRQAADSREMVLVDIVVVHATPTEQAIFGGPDGDTQHA